MKYQNKKHKGIVYLVSIIAGFFLLIFLMISSGYRQKSEEGFPTLGKMQSEIKSEDEYMLEELQQMVESKD
jgi:hypothetical protein